MNTRRPAWTRCACSLDWFAQESDGKCGRLTKWTGSCLKFSRGQSGLALRAQSGLGLNGPVFLKLDRPDIPQPSPTWAWTPIWIWTTGLAQLQSNTYFIHCGLSFSYVVIHLDRNEVITWSAMDSVEWSAFVGNNDTIVLNTLSFIIHDANPPPDRYSLGYVRYQHHHHHDRRQNLAPTMLGFRYMNSISPLS